MSNRIRCHVNGTFLDHLWFKLEVFVLLELVSLPLDKLVAVDVVVMTFLDSLWFKRFVVIKKLVIFPANSDKFVALDDVMIVDFFR